MEISYEAIKKIRDIYKQEFHEDIDDRTARLMAMRLLDLYRAVYNPQVEKYGSRRK